MDVTFIKSAFQKDHYPPPDLPEIAFAGRSNVGKSSLINTLVNRKRLARTSSTPGRTQAINFFRQGNRLYLVDLPGYGFARVPVSVKKSWRGMVETYLKERENLKGVVVIVDIRRDLSRGDADLLEWLHFYGIPPILVLTKADKLSRQKARNRAAVIRRALRRPVFEDPVVFSAKTREGREQVWAKINRISAPDP